MKNRAKAQPFPMTIIKRNYVIIGGLIVLFVMFPYILPIYPLHVLTLILLFVYFSQSWNIAGGFCGLFSFLPPVFIGAGAYASTLLFSKIGISPWLGMLAGVVLAIIVAIVVTYIMNRAKLPRLAFALATLAVVYVALDGAESSVLLGGSERGIQIPVTHGWVNYQFGSKAGFYYVILVMTIIIMISAWLILRTRLGLYFRAIRDNEVGAEAVGVDLMKYKLIAMSISALFCALGGSFYAQFTGYILPSTVISITDTIMMILFVAIGGIGTLWGPAVGVILLMPMGEILRTRLSEFPGLNLLIYGIVVVSILSFAPQGILNFLSSRSRSGLHPHDWTDRVKSMAGSVITLLRKQ